jgi:hypothetical protein
MENQTFYMCYVSGKNSPVKIHSTFQIADEEAKRLCRIEKRPVYVIQAIKKIELHEFVETNLSEDIPF